MPCALIWLKATALWELGGASPQAFEAFSLEPWTVNKADGLAGRRTQLGGDTDVSSNL